MHLGVYAAVRFVMRFNHLRDSVQKCNLSLHSNLYKVMLYMYRMLVIYVPPHKHNHESKVVFVGRLACT